tara:strand:- start:1245 stop:1937 length:693 start_codon:yes stop_codon:yes gene_type:complete
MVIIDIIMTTVIDMTNKTPTIVETDSSNIGKNESKKIWCIVPRDTQFKPIISARDISVILGLNPFTTRDELLKEKAGICKKQITFTDDIRRGIRLESVALEKFAESLEIPYIPSSSNTIDVESSYIMKGKCEKVICENFVLSGCADGIILPKNIIVEVKCPKRMSKKVPVYYYTQIQLYMYLYQSKSSYYIEYIENRPLNIIEVKFNERFMRSIFCHIDLFVKHILLERN